MLSWLIYAVRAFACVIIGGAGVGALLASLSADGKAVAVGLGCLFLASAYFAWPRRPNAWKADPPTDKQIAYAQRLGIAIPPGVSKGELSSMISAVTGR